MVGVSFEGETIRAWGAFTMSFQDTAAGCGPEAGLACELDHAMRDPGEVAKKANPRDGFHKPGIPRTRCTMPAVFAHK
jgi:hypothetical protein